mmetsp:Transcript_39766/g.109464  ORF Transcript_39766/g.109464 Transcript_39766/m.109464 type:complete len:204 (-) Transcript_39766:1432-2043(-)
MTSPTRPMTQLAARPAAASRANEASSFILVTSPSVKVTDSASSSSFASGSALDSKVAAQPFVPSASRASNTWSSASFRLRGSTPKIANGRDFAIASRRLRFESSEIHCRRRLGGISASLPSESHLIRIMRSSSSSMYVVTTFARCHWPLMLPSTSMPSLKGESSFCVADSSCFIAFGARKNESVPVVSSMLFSVARPLPRMAP